MFSGSTVEERQREVVENFALFDDWMGRYEYLIELGRSLPLIEDAYKTDAYRIHGCQSLVWVRPEERDGLLYFKADSDAHITKGLVALLVGVLSGQPAGAIARARFDFLDEIGLREHLSPTRKNGLAGMIGRMQAWAEACASDAAPATSP